MTASGQTARFPKSSRIQTSADFRANRENGQRLAKGCLLVNWQTLPPDSASRLGVVTSRRVGKSTVRNQARRMIRECFRLHQRKLLEPVDLVLVARQSIAGRGFRAVERDFLRLLKQPGLLPSSAGTVYATTDI